jgi:ketosteroid isomerase-like protein
LLGFESCPRSAICVLGFGVLAPNSLEEARPITLRFVGDLEQLRAIGKASRDAWNQHDVDAILATGQGEGFGFRAREARLADAWGPQPKAALQAWFDSLKYYRIVDPVEDVRVDHDTGITWGFFTEEFQHSGAPAERVRVRFTNVLQRDGDGWRLIWSHRDAQVFDEDGSYQRRPDDA